MLRIIIEAVEAFDDNTQTFITFDEVVVELEHSLLSVSKWESKHQIPFLSPGKKSKEEIIDYLKDMVITPDIGLDALDRCSQKNLVEIQEYIDSSQSATTFGEMPERRGRGEVITSELIYYWMIAFNVPFECQQWHLNRLFALIRICNIKNSKQKKIPRHELALRNRELNAKRKAKLGTSG
jgi:hypothetical protein